jgi:hypothetical protein
VERRQESCILRLSNESLCDILDNSAVAYFCAYYCIYFSVVYKATTQKYLFFVYFCNVFCFADRDNDKKILLVSLYMRQNTDHDEWYKSKLYSESLL